MSYHQALKQSALVVGLLALMLTGLTGNSLGQHYCKPGTPCPCAADGVCRPNRTTWGYTAGRWRSWPGEPIEQAAMPDDADATGKETTPPLPAVLLPTPEQEDLRGPAKEPKQQKQQATEEAADEAPAAAPIELPGAPAPAAPAPVELPAFDPQGVKTLPAFPLEDDLPPSLPASLRQTALPQPATTTVTSKELPTVKTALLSQPAPNQKPSIKLINPASATLAQPKPQPLQRAIYIEPK